MLVQIIKEVPDEIFNPANEEIKAIDWDKIVDHSRSSSPVFSTSNSIQLRITQLPVGAPVPKNFDELSMIVDTMDHPENYSKFPKVVKLAQWMKEQVNGVKIGRIMIVSLAARGNILAHIDPLTYFEVHARYHIPFKTNKEVVFHEGSGLNTEHMPYKFLCRLNNKALHAVDNNSDEPRIHLIVDIEIEGGNKIF
jgi:hypothetical protein